MCCIHMLPVYTVRVNWAANIVLRIDPSFAKTTAPNYHIDFIFTYLFLLDAHTNYISLWTILAVCVPVK